MAENKESLKKRVRKLLSQYFNNINFQRLFIIILSFLIVLIITVSPVYHFLDLKGYDLFMTFIKRPVKQDDSLILIDIDDNTMNWLKSSWPIARNYHGDVMEILADFDAKLAVFDIEFLEESVVGADIKRIDIVKQNLADKFQLMLDDYTKTTDSLSKSPAGTRVLNQLWNSFNEKISKYYMEIDENINNIRIDNDEYFSNRLNYYGRAYGTVNMLVDPNLTKADVNQTAYQNEIGLLKKYGYDKKELLKGRKNHQALVNVNISEFPIDVFLNEYKGVGFTYVERDMDATIRGVNLFMERDGSVIPQLALRPFLDIFDIKKEQIDLSNNRYVILRDVNIGSIKQDIKIPVYEGLMKINWPSSEFRDIFTNKTVGDKKYHFSYFDLLNYKYVIVKQFLDSLAKNFTKYHERTEENYFYQYFTGMQAEKERMLKDRTFGSMKEQFFADYNENLENLKKFLSDENIKLKEEEVSKGLAEKTEDIRKSMLEVRDSLEIMIKAMNELSFLKDKICFIGHTATGTSDIGATPFDRTFENVGVHPSLFNTILQKDFIYSVSTLLIFIITLLFFGLLIWYLMKFESVYLAPIGLAITFLSLVLIMVFYRFTNIYISPVIPVLYSFLSVVVMIAFKFIMAEKEKSFIRDAFDKYLSPDYIDEILKEKTKLNLGGERRVCTAMFTDIQGFSTISEKFMNDPPGLVSLLKDYLSSMSDIILDNKGTIDKYEGDAIIAFFGAPKDMADHAYRACLSSIKMKQIEDQLNSLLLGQKIIDTPLLTRIGINTGDMFVGNMGTNNKFNYTMMGHAVNLASRLEGVNKQYKTYQLISEYTYELVKEQIIVRKLDRVRVLNINIPVRLYELFALKDEIKPETMEFLKAFERALNEFEKRNWKESMKIFNEVLKIKKDDQPSLIYIDRCSTYLNKKAPPSSWDGVYNLGTK